MHLKALCALAAAVFVLSACNKSQTPTEVQHDVATAQAEGQRDVADARADAKEANADADKDGSAADVHSGAGALIALIRSAVA